MRTPKIPPTAFYCGACGCRIDKAQGGGLYFSATGRMHEYLLCNSCNCRRERDPESVLAQVEFRFAKLNCDA